MPEARPEAQQLSRLFDRVSDCLMDNGWEFSYLDSRGVEESEVEGGWLVHGDLRWDVLILPGVETLSQQAMDRIAEFVLDGGRLVVLNALPKNSPDEFPSAGIVRRFNELAGRRGTCSPGRLLRTAVRARTAEYAARRHSYARHRLCASQGYSLCS